MAGSNVSRVMVDLPVEGLTQGHLALLIDRWRDGERLDDLGLQRVFATLGEAARAESARRVAEAAEQRDPLGFVWFGRLSA